jgi:hypothetical protein
VVWRKLDNEELHSAQTFYRCGLLKQDVRAGTKITRLLFPLHTTLQNENIKSIKEAKRT